MTSLYFMISYLARYGSICENVCGAVVGPGRGSDGRSCGRAGRADDVLERSVEQDGEGFRGVEPKLLEEMFAWGGCRVRVAKEVSGLVALPVGACCGDDIEGGGV